MLSPQLAQISDRNQRLELQTEEQSTALGLLMPSGVNDLPLFSSDAKIARLEEVRRVKEADIEKYKKYLNKAKKIIENFGEGKSRAAEDSMEVMDPFPVGVKSEH